jgi:hypothetical protein
LPEELKPAAWCPLLAATITRKPRSINVEPPQVVNQFGPRSLIASASESATAKALL